MLIHFDHLNKIPCAIFLKLLPGVFIFGDCRIIFVLFQALNTQLCNYSNNSSEIEKYKEEIQRLTNLNEENQLQFEKLREELKTANSSHVGS